MKQFISKITTTYCWCVALFLTISALANSVSSFPVTNLFRGAYLNISSDSEKSKHGNIEYRFKEQNIKVHVLSEYGIYNHIYRLSFSMLSDWPNVVSLPELNTEILANLIADTAIQCYDLPPSAMPSVKKWIKIINNKKQRGIMRLKKDFGSLTIAFERQASSRVDWYSTTFTMFRDKNTDTWKKSCTWN